MLHHFCNQWSDGTDIDIVCEQELDRSRHLRGGTRPCARVNLEAMYLITSDPLGKDPTKGASRLVIDSHDRRDGSCALTCLTASNVSAAPAAPTQRGLLF